VLMDHHVLEVSAAGKSAVVQELSRGRGHTLLFCRTKHAAKKLARQLNTAGITAVDLHGNLSQGARERNLAAFTAGTHRVLVATDIAARGIHVDDVELVVHVDPPVDHKVYLHRSGRTARAGASGIVVTLATADERRDVTMLTRKAGITPTRTAVNPGHPLLLELTGPVAELDFSTPPPTSPESSDRSGGHGGGRSAGGRSSGGRTAGGHASGGRSSGAASGRSGGSAGGRASAPTRTSGQPAQAPSRIAGAPLQNRRPARRPAGAAGRPNRGFSSGR